MVIIRPTVDLTKRMKMKLQSKLTSIEEKSTTFLGDWSATDLVLDRKQYVLCVSEHGRLPLVLKAAPYSTFPERLIETLPELLHKIGIPSVEVKREISRMERHGLAKNCNRSVLGTINQLRKELEAKCQEGSILHDPMKMSLELADYLSLLLPERTPRESVLKIFGVSIRPHYERFKLFLVQ